MADTSLTAGQSTRRSDLTYTERPTPDERESVFFGKEDPPNHIRIRRGRMPKWKRRIPVPDDRYPRLSEAIEGGLYHPNCKDIHTTYFEGVSSPPKPITPAQEKRAAEIYDLEQRQRYNEWQIRRFRRLADNTLDPAQKQKYSDKLKQWQQVNADFVEAHGDVLKHRYEREDIRKLAVRVERPPVSAKEALDKSDGSGIIRENNTTIGESVLTQYTTLGNVNPDYLAAEFGELQTNEVIVTNERVEHIRDHHPDDIKLFEEYGSKVISDPDLIIKDSKNEGTVFMVGRLPETNLNVVVRLALSGDTAGYKNSVMTFYRIREKNLIKLKNKNKVLYNRE